MTKNKRRHGELRYVDSNRYNKHYKQIQRKGNTRKDVKNGWETIAWINCKTENTIIFDNNKLSVQDMEEIIIYIKLNREIWRRYAFPSANILGLSVKKRMSVADTRRLPVESLIKTKLFVKQKDNEVKK